MRPFLCKFYSAEKIPDSKLWKICLENLLINREFGSKMDIKLGTSTITNTPNWTEEKIERRNSKDKESTTHMFGFTICGMSLKNPETGEYR